MRTPSEPVQYAIALCRECHNVCLDTFFNHCLDMGGAHVAHDHALAMNDCIQACQTAADFMARGSVQHRVECEACARICDICARSCEVFDCEEMKACAQICRRCAESCRRMTHLSVAA